MANQVEWTQKRKDAFIEYGCLTGLDKDIIASRRIKSRVQLHFDNHCSIRCVDEHIAHLKLLYDVVQKEHPDIFDKRKV